LGGRFAAALILAQRDSKSQNPGQQYPDDGYREK
jgi:hypothetical protein